MKIAKIVVGEASITIGRFGVSSRISVLSGSKYIGFTLTQQEMESFLEAALDAVRSA